MSGYLIVPDDCCSWSGGEPGKLTPHPIRLGLFDLLREFEQSPFPYDRRSPGVTLIRLDLLLAEMGVLEPINETLEHPFLIAIKLRLKAVAGEVNNMPTIHIPIACALDHGGSGHLYARYAGKRIPLWRLFGTNPSIDSIDGKATYSYGVNLS